VNSRRPSFGGQQKAAPPFGLARLFYVRDVA
jgi:hypothetical protein